MKKVPIFLFFISLLIYIHAQEPILHPRIALIQQHAPFLSFHPEEGNQCCYPSDAETSYTLIQKQSFYEIREPKILNPQAPCYFDVDEKWIEEDAQHSWRVKEIRIRYWFWYTFNDFPQGPDPCGSHEGDWESVEVIVREKIGYAKTNLQGNTPAPTDNQEPEEHSKRETKDNTTPTSQSQDHTTPTGESILSSHVHIYLLSNHTTCLYICPEQAQLINGRIKVWVANGSHAHYPSPDSEPYCEEIGPFRFCDEIADGGAVWDTSQHLVDIRKTTFSQFTGLWGNHDYQANFLFTTWTFSPPTSPIIRQFEYTYPAQKNLVPKE